jgi:hypothetical protein
MSHLADLCAKCALLSFEQMKSRGGQPHHDRWDDLKAVAPLGCRICTFFFTTIYARRWFSCDTPFDTPCGFHVHIYDTDPLVAFPLGDCDPDLDLTLTWAAQERMGFSENYTLYLKEGACWFTGAQHLLD